MHKPWCDLEIHVDEEHVFVVRQKPLISFCSRISKLLNRTFLRCDSAASSAPLTLPRILLQEFPGGAPAFELVAIFCYNGGSIPVTHSNVSLLRCVAEFLEMSEEHHRDNLVRITETYLQDLVTWDWETLLKVLRGCEPVLALAKQTKIVQRCADALAWKICCSLEDESSVFSSPDSGLQHLIMHSGSVSRKSPPAPSGSKACWWFAGIASLPAFFMEEVLKTLICNDVDNKILARFLTHYMRSSLPVFGYINTASSSTKLKSPDEDVAAAMQCKLDKHNLTVLEVGVNLLFHLERGSASCRFLFGLFRMATALNASKACKRQLEKMIGSQLHVANLDSILLPLHPPRSASLFDVDFVYRLVVSFFKDQELARCSHEGQQLMTVETPATRVGDLIDSYLAEVAPDVNLSLDKFRRLAHAVPASARWSSDGVYRAVDIYLEAHPSLTPAEVMALCRVIDIHKLSFDACSHISRNPRLPARFALQVVLNEQAKLREALVGGSLKETTTTATAMALSPILQHSKSLGDAHRCSSLKSDLSEISLKVAELEKVCRSMRTDVVVAKQKNKTRRRLLC